MKKLYKSRYLYLMVAPAALILLFFSYAPMRGLVMAFQDFSIFRGFANYRMLIYAIAVVLIIMFKPSGLYGYKEFSLKRTIAFWKNLFSKKEKAVAANTEKGDK